MSSPRSPRPPDPPDGDEGPDPGWSLTLYVSGAAPRSAAAIDNLRQLCDEDLQGEVDLEIVDARERPSLAGGDDVVALPTLVKRVPRPPRRIVGDLSDLAHLHLFLGVASRHQSEGGEGDDT